MPPSELVQPSCEFSPRAPDFVRPQGEKLQSQPLNPMQLPHREMAGMFFQQNRRGVPTPSRRHEALRRRMLPAQEVAARLPAMSSPVAAQRKVKAATLREFSSTGNEMSTTVSEHGKSPEKVE